MNITNNNNKEVRKWWRKRNCVKVIMKEENFF